MATQFFRFLGKGLGFYASDVSGGQSCAEQKGGESCDEQKRGEPPVQARINEEVLIEQLFSSVPKDLGVTRADVKEALSSTGHNIFETALALKSRVPAVKPPILSRSLSETLYEDLGCIHSMEAIQKALDATGRDNIMQARRVLEHNPIDYNRYCCFEVHRYDEEKQPDSECALCFMESDAIDTDLLRLPCGLRTCSTCLQAKITDDVRSGNCPMCPGLCDKRLMPAIVKSSMRYLCGLCGRNFDKKQKIVVSCCESHAFCSGCLADHVKGSIRLKLSPMCPRSSECHYTLAVPEVKRILEHSVRAAGTPNLASATVWLMKTYFNQIVPPHIARHASSFSRECLGPLCAGQMELPDAAVLATLRGGGRAEGTGACKRCRRDWCLTCHHVAHPGISCGAAERMAGKWQEFMTMNRHLFADSPLAKQLQQKYYEDKLTADIVKRCPHCKKGPIFRIDGCSQMICGSDAVDKRTSNTFGDWKRYRGCGRSFIWSNALPCRPAACHGKPAGSVALAAEVGRINYDSFFRGLVTGGDAAEVLSSLITLNYLPTDPDILLLACKHVCGEEIALGLINANCDVNVREGDESPLMLACQHQWSECVVALIAAKASVTHRCKDGNTPLLQSCVGMCSAASPHPEVIEALLGAGADVKECLLSNGQSPLLLACARHADPECIALLAGAGAALNARREEDQQTPLLLACAHNSAGVVSKLLRAKADSNMGVGDRSPLLVACQQSNPRCVRPLIRAKADAQIRDASGRSLVEIIGQHSKSSLPERRDQSCVMALVRAKAHITVDHRDWQVCVNDREAFASALASAGSDVTIVHNNCLDAIAALLKAKADPSGHGGEIAVLSLNSSSRRTRPLQQLLAVSETEDSFQVRFSLRPPQHRARVRLSMRQVLDAGPSEDANKPSCVSTTTERHEDSEKILGCTHHNTPHGKSAWRRREFVGRRKSKRTYGKSTSLLDKARKRKSKPKRAWQSLRGKRTYQREWSRA